MERVSENGLCVLRSRWAGIAARCGDLRRIVSRLRSGGQLDGFPSLVAPRAHHRCSRDSHHLHTRVRGHEDGHFVDFQVLTVNGILTRRFIIARTPPRAYQLDKLA